MVSAPPAPPPFRVSQRLRYRELLGLVAVTATFTTVAIAAPILGGFVANVVGYPVVFGLGGVIVASNLLLIRRRVAPSESFAFSIDLRRTAPRTTLAFSGQGGVDGLLSAATPLGSFLFTTNSLALGLLFALFSLAAGVAALLLGRASDRVRTRAPFLLLGPILSVPACILAFAVRDLGAHCEHRRRQVLDCLRGAAVRRLGARSGRGGAPSVHR